MITICLVGKGNKVLRQTKLRWSSQLSGPSVLGRCRCQAESEMILIVHKARNSLMHFHASGQAGRQRVPAFVFEVAGGGDGDDGTNIWFYPAM